MDRTSAIPAANRRLAVERLSHFVAASVDAARAREAPFQHLVLERIFPGDLYNAMQTAMPVASDYRPMSGRSRSNRAPDGAPTRVKIDLFPEYIRHLPPQRHAIWDLVGRALCSRPVKEALVRRLAPGLRRRFGADFTKVGVYPIPILTRDFPGYRITPHTDTRWKAITVQIYLPPDDRHSRIGTIFHQRLADGSLAKKAQMRFVPNSGYAFAVGDNTWHSVDPVGPEVNARDSILLTYFVDAGVLRILRNRLKRAANFLGNEVRQAAAAGRRVAHRLQRRVRSRRSDADGGFEALVLGAALALVLLLPCTGSAEEPAAAMPVASASTEGDSAAPATGKSTALSWDSGAGKSYSIPALEIMGFNLLLNQFNRRYFDGHDYDTNLSTIRRNLHSRWVTENDPFKVNQLGHPYLGSMYHGFARSAGLTYWESLGYTFAGSTLWEIAGETTPPSRNDQIATGIGGTFLGEALFRMASLVLERADGTPPFWRELSAAVISPSTGFNRLAFGDRFNPVFSSRDAVYYSRVAAGVSHAPQNSPGASTRSGRVEALADFSIDYGLPGKPDYTYRRPFDYFTFQATASSANGFENVMTRGLLLGKDYEAGRNYRGVWGLYGSYDYISPQFFRVSSTALSLGTTGQSWLTDSIALQGTALAGVGYAAVGTLRGAGDRDYHYGVAPQALLALRLIFGDTASLDVTARDYFVTRVSAADRAGHDDIARVDVALTWRIQKQHAIAIKYLWNRREAAFPDLGDRTQTRGTIGIYYTYLGHLRFGAVDWR